MNLVCLLIIFVCVGVSNTKKYYMRAAHTKLARTQKKQKV